MAGLGLCSASEERSSGAGRQAARVAQWDVGSLSTSTALALVARRVAAVHLLERLAPRDQERVVVALVDNACVFMCPTVILCVFMCPTVIQSIPHVPHCNTVYFEGYP